MSHPQFNTEEVARRGEEIYEASIRPRVEIERNIGRIISIDIETCDYKIGDDLVVTAGCLHEKRTGAAVWTKRIGYNAVYALGGTVERIK